MKKGVEKNTHVNYRRLDFKGSRDDQRQNMVNYMENVLEFNIARGHLAPVVYDIDATLVDAREDVIPSVARLYRKYLNIVPTYIVTARPDVGNNEELTRAMLKKNRLEGYKALYLMPPSAQSPAQFKWRKRIEIGRQHGHHPQMTVGDQSWDALASPVPRDAKDMMIDRHNGAIVDHETGRGEIGCLLPDIEGA